LRLVVAALQETGHKIIKDLSEVDVHGFTVHAVTIVVNY
jgi:hypothetical protein